MYRLKQTLLLFAFPNSYPRGVINLTIQQCVPCKSNLFDYQSLCSDSYSSDLRVGHEEDDADRLDARLQVEASEVELQVCDAVALAQRDLEHLERADGGGETRQRLLAAAAHADQQRIAARRLQDPIDAQDVLDGVDEEDEVHRGVDLVVRVERLREDLREVFVALHRHVLRVADAEREVTVEVRLGEHGRLVNVLQTARRRVRRTTGRKSCLARSTATDYNRHAVRNDDNYFDHTHYFEHTHSRATVVSGSRCHSHLFAVSVSGPRCCRRWPAD